MAAGDARTYAPVPRLTLARRVGARRLAALTLAVRVRARVQSLRRRSVGGRCIQPWREFSGAGLAACDARTYAPDPRLTLARRVGARHLATLTLAVRVRARVQSLRRGSVFGRVQQHWRQGAVEQASRRAAYFAPVSTCARDRTRCVCARCVLRHDNRIIQQNTTVHMDSEYTTYTIINI